MTSSGTVSTSKQVPLVSDKNTSTITLKHGRRLKMARIDKLLDTSMSITEKSKDDIDIWAKDFCIKTVLTGANKMVSQAFSSFLSILTHNFDIM